MKRFGIIVLCICTILSCSKKDDENDDDIIDNKDTTNVEEFEVKYQDHEEWSYNLSMYEVNVRQYTREGTFKAFENHLDRLKQLGIGILWFMPIHPIGKEKRLGTLGSYYSVQDYKKVNPEFGTMNDFKNLVNKIHEKDMFVIIDWVANHTSWDNVLTTQHPEWYNKNSEGEFIPPPGTNWSDVIDLDFSNTSLREYMIEAMKFWVRDVGIDGFRCDAVDFVPIDFWTEAITELKNLNPGIIMLAEGEGVKYHNAGFDVTYAWSLHGFKSGIMVSIYNGIKNVSALDAFINNAN